MKKLLIPVLLLSMITILSGCGTKQAAEPQNNDEQVIEQVEETAVEIPAEAENSEIEQTASAQ